MLANTAVLVVDDCLKGRAFDLIISDVEMPIMNGDQLLQFAKQNVQSRFLLADSLCDLIKNAPAGKETSYEKFLATLNETARDYDSIYLKSLGKILKVGA